MSDAGARYGLALPDNYQYQGLVERLPLLARQQLGLEVFFVAGTEAGFAVREG